MWSIHTGEKRHNLYDSSEMIIFKAGHEGSLSDCPPLHASHSNRPRSRQNTHIVGEKSNDPM